jgi:hypothetical protein
MTHKGNARRAARAGTQSSTCRHAEQHVRHAQQHVPARTAAYECMYSALTIVYGSKVIRGIETCSRRHGTK